MANHPNRSWRGRWRVDVVKGIAVHRDGWEFKLGAVEKAGESILSYDCLKKPDPLTPELELKFDRVAREALDIYREQILDIAGKKIK